MRGLGHISGMQAVVVGHISMVVTLQRQQVGDKRVHWDLEGLEQVPFLVHHRPPVRTSASGQQNALFLHSVFSFWTSLHLSNAPSSRMPSILNSLGLCPSSLVYP